jgi:lipoprotein signal peptidase
MRVVRRLHQPDRVFWSLTLMFAMLDAATKRLAEGDHGFLRWLDHALGGLVSFPLTYNPGAAFSLRYGFEAPLERLVQIMCTAWALVFLYALFRRVAYSARTAVVGLGMMSGGGTGNLLDRVRHPAGVVDFINVDVGVLRLFVFNLADVAALAGATLLLWALCRREIVPPEGFGEEPAPPAAAQGG